MNGYLIIALSASVTAWFFAQAKSISPAMSDWQLAAQLAGVFGLLGLSWNYILAVRHRFLEKIFGGLDRVYRLHGFLGGTTLILLLHHPLFLIVNNLPVNTVKNYLLPGTVSLAYTLGVLALYLLLILAVLTLYVDLPYWLWKKTHEWMGLAVILGGLHSLLVPSDISVYPPLRFWLIGWAGAGLTAYLYKRFLYYWFQPKNNYVLERLISDGETVVATLKPVSPLLAIVSEPGQYAFLSLNLPGRGRDEHPFSIINNENGRLMVGFKVIGGFTLAMGQSAVGTPVTVRGPFGAFGLPARRAKEMIWISGGIGITPFASMMFKLLPEQKVTMFHSSSGSQVKPKVISGMFELWSGAHPNFSWVSHLTGVMGRLNAGIIAARTKISRHTYFFLCGPPAMARALAEQLAGIGVRRRQIIYEDFGFR